MRILACDHALLTEVLGRASANFTICQKTWRSTELGPPPHILSINTTPCQHMALLPPSNAISPLLNSISRPGTLNSSPATDTSSTMRNIAVPVKPWLHSST